MTEILIGSHIWVNGVYEGIATRYDGSEGVILKKPGEAEVRWNRYSAQVDLIVTQHRVYEAQAQRTENPKTTNTKAENVANAAAKLVDIKTRSGGYQWWTWIAERAEQGEEECAILMELRDAVDEWRNP